MHLVTAARHELRRRSDGPATSQLLQRVTQTYRVLFTRALKGVYVWLSVLIPVSAWSRQSSERLTTATRRSAYASSTSSPSSANASSRRPCHMPFSNSASISRGSESLLSVPRNVQAGNPSRSASH
jgi:hypothetical protein